MPARWIQLTIPTTENGPSKVVVQVCHIIAYGRWGAGGWVWLVGVGNADEDLMHVLESPGEITELLEG